MQKITTFLGAILMTLSVAAQSHLTFKNIPIDGTITEFADKLQADGFTYSKKTNDGSWYKGKFAGQTCTIFIRSSSVSHTVYSVYAAFTIRNNWESVISDYNALKKALTLKYGEPQTKEKFRSYYNYGDGNEFSAMKNGYADWMSLYSNDLGKINLYIKEQSTQTGCVIIQYEDAANSAKMIEELTADL